MILRIYFATLFAFGSVATRAADSGSANPYRTFFVTRSMAHERLIPYLEAARPEIVQIGQYGAMFHGYADNPKSKGTPMQLPIIGERKVLDFQRDLNRMIHDLGLKVVGHFRFGKAFGNWDERTGFVEYYDKRWPEDLLGPKPHPNLLDLLQRDSAGKPIPVSRYNNDQLAFCLSSPHARQMFKQMLKVAIDHGVDGVITTYNYHFNCACLYCQTSFKTWLREHVGVADVRQKLGVKNLDSHVFDTIPARIGGYPDVTTAGDLDWFAMRWAAENFKANFDDIFIRYGRKLKPDLLVAQWNHLGHVGAGNERTFLPIEQWGKGESYFWESGGASFVGKNLNLTERKAGDAWLSCLVVRELGGGKPFVMGKYDGLRLAANMAEGYATGGLGMGRYMRFEDPDGFDTLVRYTQFMRKHRSLFDEATTLADVAIVMPRQSLLAGQSAPLDEFRTVGQELLNRQVVLDVVADENLSQDRLQNFRAVLVPQATLLTKQQQAILRDFKKAGGTVLDRIKSSNVETVFQQVRSLGRFQVDAPWTVRVAAYRKGESKLMLHLVNYNRDEGTTKEERGKKPINERPLAVKDVTVRITTEKKPKAVMLYRPDSAKPARLAFKATPGKIEFLIPELLVYGVVELLFE